MARQGIACDFASPRGGKPPLDAKSESPRDEINRSFLGDAELSRKLNESLELSKIDPGQYRAIYFAGGHGAMGDFPTDKSVIGVAEAVHEAGGWVTAVCHGSAGLLGLRGKDGKPLISGKRVTGFANIEESLVGLTKKVPFSLEDELVAKGGLYRKSILPFLSHVEADGRLITGQNPQSPHAVGERLVEALSQK
jgi:putative intracellular protease/amidase